LTVYTPGFAVEAAFTVIVLVKVGSPEAGSKLTVTPAGTSVARRVVSQVFPELSVTVTLAEVVFPGSTVKALGSNVRLDVPFPPP